MIKTDLPEPVAPAIKPWGIFCKSVIWGSPNRSTPKATVNGEEASWNLSERRTSDNMTGREVLLGISIPTLLLPGIGASIRMSLAAKASLRSSFKLVILLTLTPRPKVNSNCVTVGPIVQSLTVAST